MKEISILNQKLTVRDFVCSNNPKNIVTVEPSLRLYIKITDDCNANCKFCANNSKEFGFIECDKLNNLIEKENLQVYCNIKDFGKFNLKNLNKVEIKEDSFLNLSVEKAKNGEYKEINDIDPLYIKKSQAEQELQNKIEKNLVITDNFNLEDLINLENNCFEDAYSKKLLEEDLNNKNRKIYVAKFLDEALGYINFEVVLDEINLIKICVLSEFRNYKIASRLMEKMIQYKKENNIEKIFLEVSEKNKPAIKLYEKFNFKLLTTRKNYYKSGEDAFIYVLN